MTAARPIPRPASEGPAAPSLPAPCPLLKTIRDRLRSRLLEVDEAILAHTQPGVNGSIGMERMVRERARLVQALDLVVSASDRSLVREARHHQLQALHDIAPACITPIWRRRLRLLIEGLAG